MGRATSGREMQGQKVQYHLHASGGGGQSETQTEDAVGKRDTSQHPHERHGRDTMQKQMTERSAVKIQAAFRGKSSRLALL